MHIPASLLAQLDQLPGGRRGGATARGRIGTGGRGDEDDSEEEEEEDEEEDESDLNTQGLVALAAAVEVVLQRLINAAADIATAEQQQQEDWGQQQQQQQQEEEGLSTPGSSRKKKKHSQEKDKQQQQVEGVVLLPRHVLLAASRDDALAALLLGGFKGADVAWAGALPALHKQLLPNAAAAAGEVLGSSSSMGGRGTVEGVRGSGAAAAGGGGGGGVAVDAVAAALLELATGRVQVKGMGGATGLDGGGREGSDEAMEMDGRGWGEEEGLLVQQWLAVAAAVGATAAGEEGVGPAAAGAAAAASKSGRERETSSSCGISLSSGVVVFPLDLQVYCGRSKYEPAMASTHTTAAAASASSAPAAAGGGCSSGGSSLSRCCFASGHKCSSCQMLTTALQVFDLDQRLQLSQLTMQQLVDQGAWVLPNAAIQQLAAPVLSAAPVAAAKSTAAASLSSPDAVSKLAAGAAGAGGRSNVSGRSAECGAVAALMSLVRLYQLQLPCWGDPQWQQQLQPQERLQLARLYQQLQPLRDVAGLCEVQREQQEQVGVLGAGTEGKEHWKQMVEDVLWEVMEEQQLERETAQQQEQLVRLSGGGAAAADSSSGRYAAAVGGSDVGGGGGKPLLAEEAMEIEFSKEALEALAVASEGLLVEQLRLANSMAVAAGRQEVGWEDLRMALLASGNGHLDPARQRSGGLVGSMKELYMTEGL